MGCTDLNGITILGEELAAVKRPFARLSMDREIFEKLSIRRIDCEACSGCHNAINSYLYNLHQDGRLEKLKDSVLIYGQNPHLPENAYPLGKHRIIRLGTCTRNMAVRDCPNDAGIYVPGCPPHPLHIDDFLEGRGFEKE